MALNGMGGNVGSDTRGVFAGGAGYTTAMEYITYSTPSNSTTFGNLAVGKTYMAGTCSPTRGLFAGVFNPPTYLGTQEIEYITIDTTGNATTFGDMTVGSESLATMTSNTRGVFAGGVGVSHVENVMDYVTIDTTGNATDFGDLTIATSNLAGASGN